LNDQHRLRGKTLVSIAMGENPGKHTQLGKNPGKHRLRGKRLVSVAMGENSGKHRL